MTESNVNNVVAETEPGYGQVFAVLLRRRFWLLSVLCAVLSIALVRTLTTQPTYQSSMQLLVEPNYQGKKEGSGAKSEYIDTNVEVDTATQLNLMRSAQLLQKAVNLLSPEYPNTSIDEIKNSLVVTQVMEDEVNTNIFQAVYTGNNPIKTEKALEAIQKVYQNYNREQQKQRLIKGLGFIDAQLPIVRASLIKSEAALERFRKSQNLIEPEEQAKALSGTLSSIEQERRTIAAQYQDAQARYNSLQQQLARSPQGALVSSRLSQSSPYQALLSEIQKTELAIAQLRVRFTDTTPKVQELLEQRQQQLALLQQEVRRVLGGSAAQSNGTEESPLTVGQFSEVDLDLTTQLVEAQTNLLGLKARDQRLAQQEQQLRAQLDRFPRVLAEYNRLQPDILLKRNTLQQLEEARQELSLEIARGGFDWQVVEEPQPGAQIGPNVKQNLLLGLVAGLMLGGAAAFVREMVDDTVHTCDDLKQQVVLPLLGTIPKLPPANTGELIVKLPFGKPQVLKPWTIEVIHWSPSWELLDLIYLNAQLLNSANQFKSLMITSALTGEGKSTLALGLALSAARLHQRVLLIDADLRRPNLHKMLNIPNEHGLSTLLASDAPVPSPSSIPSSGAYIDILTAGSTSIDPANLLSSHRMKELMAAFEQTYDLILLDAPPVLGMVDAILTGSFCNGVVLVSRINKLKKSELTQATATLSKLNVIGVVANDAKGSTNGYIPQPEIKEGRARGLAVRDKPSTS